MKTYTDPQGSDAWKASRAGVITASMFSTARDKLKSGAPSKAARDYAFRIALERIGGLPLDDGNDTWAMKRGRDLEPVARERLARALNTTITVPGFITDEDGKYGASADGFIGETGGCEIKCLVDPSRIAKVLVDGDLSEFDDQIQGCMWITGRAWWEYALYLPQLAKARMDLYHKRVYRNEQYIDDLKKDLVEFEKIVQANIKGLRENARVEVEGF